MIVSPFVLHACGLWVLMLLGKMSLYLDKMDVTQGLSLLPLVASVQPPSQNTGPKSSDASFIIHSECQRNLVLFVCVYEQVNFKRCLWMFCTLSEIRRNLKASLIYMKPVTFYFLPFDISKLKTHSTNWLMKLIM